MPWNNFDFPTENVHYLGFKLGKKKKKTETKLVALIDDAVINCFK